MIGLPLEHMFEQVSRHSGFIEVKAKGDLIIDDHHLIEDLAITLEKPFLNTKMEQP